jgi:hypothetical protein
MLRAKAFFAAVLWCVLCCQANAEVLTATETVVGSGIFNGTPFTDALVTLRGTLDSSTFELDTNNGLASVSLQENATVTVGGVSDTLTGRSSNPTNGLQFNGGFELDSSALSVTGTTFSGADVGFENVILILSTSDMNANYATALKEPGSLSGRAGVDPGYQFMTTSGGFFELNTASSNATFTIAAAPEPGSLVLSCLGAVGAALVARRKSSRRHGT